MPTRKKATSDHKAERDAIAAGRSALAAARAALAEHAAALERHATALEAAARRGDQVGQHPDDGEAYSAPAWLSWELGDHAQQLQEELRIMELELETTPRERVRAYLSAERAARRRRRALEARERRTERLAERHDPRRVEGPASELRWLGIARKAATIAGRAWLPEAELYRELEARTGVAIRAATTSLLGWAAGLRVVELREFRGRLEVRSPARANLRRAVAAARRKIEAIAAA